MHTLRKIWYSFPIQLLIVHLRYDFFLLLLWLFFLALMLGLVGKSMGFHYLFLEPEYLGVVNFRSFFITGIAFGIFFLTFNMASYSHQSHRFTFLAALRTPFTHYCINNSIIPALFLFIYFYEVYTVHRYTEDATRYEIISYFEGFIAGLMLCVVVIAPYLYLSNKNLKQIAEKKKIKKIFHTYTTPEDMLLHNPDRHSWQVDYYISARLIPRAVRRVDHYNRELLRAVFRQNHFNNFIVQAALFLLLVFLGYLVEVPLFQLPPSASMLLGGALITMFIAMINYWMGGWSFLAFIIIFYLIGLISRSETLSPRNKIYGIDYLQKPKEYSLSSINENINLNNLRADLRSGREMLNNRYNTIKKKYPYEKSKMILIGMSGGGTTAGYWTMNVLQQADSLVNGRLLDQTYLMTGASGGMLAGAYLRELYLRKINGDALNIWDYRWADNIAKDKVNALAFMALTNDILWPQHRFDYNGYSYYKDRGYAFEADYNEDTGYLLNKSLAEYTDDEMNGNIPMMVLSPMVINDNRTLYIASQPVSYLCRPMTTDPPAYLHDSETDGIDFVRFFDRYCADDILMTTALRMNATFPLLFPPVFLPTEPPVRVMDAGMRDNFGFEATYRYAVAFENWIKKNIDQVIWIEIRYREKIEDIAKFTPGFLDRTSLPINQNFDNTGQMMDFYNDIHTAALTDRLDGKIEKIVFDLKPVGKKERISMSLHLTQKEKKEVRNALQNEANIAALKRLIELLKK